MEQTNSTYLYVVAAPAGNKENDLMVPFQVHATVDMAVRYRMKKGLTQYPIYEVRVIREIPQSELFKHELFKHETIEGV